MRDRATLLIVLASLVCCLAALPQRSAYEPVVGTWQLFEIGNDDSGGFNYVIKPISSHPAQTIELGREGRFRTNVSAPFFRSLYSSVREYRVEWIAGDTYSIIYQKKQRRKTTAFRQGLQLRNDTLRLNPLCYEGCHFSFVRIK